LFAGRIADFVQRRRGHSMNRMMELLSWASDVVWGPFLLIPLLLATGLYLTVRLRGLQFHKLGHALRLAFLVRRETEGEGDISHFQALMTALSATVGTGNIVGVATAIAAGGPGALFWMWMTGLVGMATKYAEALLSVKFRRTNERGQQCGGPMYYLSEGIRWRPLGRTLGWLFAVFTAIAAFGIGNMAQSNSVAHALRNAAGAPRWISGLIIAGLLASVTLGGIKWIGRFTGTFVPVMIVLYMAGSGWILIRHVHLIPEMLAMIFRTAFTGSAATGGFLGAGVMHAIRFGVARGIFSNESGLGSAGIAAAAAQTTQPVRQALVSMTQTFIDTLIVCTMTGLCILVTGVWQSGAQGATLTQLAFENGLPGQWGSWIVSISLAMFAFSTIIGWSYYGDRSIEYLLGLRAVIAYRVLFIIAAYAGAVYSLEFVWTLSDLLNGLMALPNLVGLILLSPLLVHDTRKYLNQLAMK
jgi:alanine or glycine:cation symporter, AGCS family